jgi:hypothetical protein
MQIVDTILQVSAYYRAYCVSYLYNPFLGGSPERTTAVYLRDGNGSLVNVMLSSAASMSEVLR